MHTYNPEYALLAKDIKAVVLQRNLKRFGVLAKEAIYVELAWYATREGAYYAM